MDELKNENINELELEEESSIDFKAILDALWKHKLLYAIVVPLSIVVGAIYAKSLPKYYQCQVTLAPELGGGTTGGCFSSASAHASI